MLKSVKSCFCMHQNQSSFRLFERNSDLLHAKNKTDQSVNLYMVIRARNYNTSLKLSKTLVKY